MHVETAWDMAEYFMNVRKRQEKELTAPITPFKSRDTFHHEVSITRQPDYLKLVAAG